MTEESVGRLLAGVDARIQPVDSVNRAARTRRRLRDQLQRMIADGLGDRVGSGVDGDLKLLVPQLRLLRFDLLAKFGHHATKFRNHGFRVAVVGSQPYPGVAAGIVIRQSPQAGFQIAPGEPISLEVSR